MEDSILISTKKILGISDEYTVFDLDIITHINASFAVLSQLGIGPTNWFSIEDETDLWSDFLPNGNLLSMTRTYIFLKVRLLFDPPTTSFLLSAMENQIKEYEWRMSVFREGNQT